MSSVRQTQLEAIKQRLEPLAPGRAGADRQRLEIEKLKAASDADTARAREQATVASENARIEREQSTRIAEIQKSTRAAQARDRGAVELRSAQDRQLDRAGAQARRGSESAGARPSSRAPRSCSPRSQLQTERERAVAERSREIALKREQERGEVETSKAESETGGAADDARKAEASATTTRAEAQRIRLTGRIRRHAGDDRRRELAHRRADAPAARAASARPLPEIIAQMMKPAEKIDSIRIHQVTGFGGSSNGTAAAAAAAAATRHARR